MTTTPYSIISEDAICYDAQGYITASGVEVCDYHDGTIGIGVTVHRKEDLTITPERIASKFAGWEVQL